jgi:hypothetical protein
MHKQASAEWSLIHTAEIAYAVQMATFGLDAHAQLDLRTASTTDPQTPSRVRFCR